MKLLRRKTIKLYEQKSDLVSLWAFEQKGRGIAALLFYVLQLDPFPLLYDD